MKSGSKVGIVGGGYAARALARRLKYEFEVTLLSRKLYHLENEHRLANVFGGRLHEEEGLTKHEDLCSVHKSEAVKFEKKEDGPFKVTDAKGGQFEFDHLVLALGNQSEESHRKLFSTSHNHLFTTYTSMQSMRLRYCRETLCRGQLRIFSGGANSKCLFNAISVNSHDEARPLFL